MRLWSFFFLLVPFSHSIAQPGPYRNFDFSKADSIAFTLHGHELRDKKALTYLLTRNLDTDVEKFRAIFRWITDNIEYDYDLYLSWKKKEQKHRYNRKKLMAIRRQIVNQTYTRTIQKKRAICMGYARLLEEMCHHAGIESKFISGYSRGYQSTIGRAVLDHAWNAVRLDGKWHLCDPTWASGYVEEDARRFVRSFNANYFLVNPQYFAVSHYPADPSWLLIHPRPSFQDFVRAPLKTDGFISNEINQYYPGSGILTIKRGDTAVFRFTSNLEHIDPDAGVFVAGKKKAYHIHAIAKDNEGFYIVEHPFRERGAFKVAIYINRTHTLQYSVNVR